MAESMTLSEFADELFLIADFCSNPDFERALTDDVAPVMREGIGENFARASNPDGQAWPPRRHSYPWPPLIKSGAMRASLVEEGGDGYTLATEESITLASSVRSSAGFNYPSLHNFGGRRMPQREFAGLSETWEERCAEALIPHVAHAMLYGVPIVGGAVGSRSGPRGPGAGGRA